MLILWSQVNCQRSQKVVWSTQMRQLPTPTSLCDTHIIPFCLQGTYYNVCTVSHQLIYVLFSNLSVQGLTQEKCKLHEGRDLAVCLPHLPLLAILEVSQNICRVAVFTPMAPGGPGYALLGAPPMKYRESWDQRQPDFLTAAGCVASSPGLCPGKSFLPAEPPALTPMVDNRQNPGGAGNNHQSCHHSDSCILLRKKWCHLVGPLLAAHLQVPAQVAAVRWPRLPHFASPEPHQSLLYQQASLLIFESEILVYHTCNNRFILNIWIQFCL